jgi:hypothetical protein
MEVSSQSCDVFIPFPYYYDSISGASVKKKEEKFPFSEHLQLGRNFHTCSLIYARLLM